MSFSEFKEGRKFKKLAGRFLAVSATSATEVVKIGRRYRITARNTAAASNIGTVVCAFATSVATGDGNFDFIISVGESIDVIATATSLSCIEGQIADMDICIQEYDD